ncbi:MAG: hypothetical protein LC733_02440 [Actinobacteria bacterium]|nr:hypothetical protein [Actinomycetota bacterium]
MSFSIFGQRRRVGLGSAVLSLLAVLMVWESPARATFPGPVNGRIACSREFNAGGTPGIEIITMDPDGGNVQRLTNNAVLDFDPIWSPDGREIVFESRREGNVSELYKMNADGSGVVRLTENGAPEDRAGSYHPDGSQIVFHSTRTGNFEIFKMNADGSNEINVTNSPTFDSLPYWYPDGTKILFTSNRGNFDVWSMDSFGGALTQLTTHPLTDATGNVSPDGSKIAFHSTRDTPAGQPQTFDVYVMNADGSNQTRLTFAQGDDFFPIWSPDGTKILFDSARTGDREVWVMNADGSNQQRITFNVGFDGRCDWQRPCTITGSGGIVGTEGDDVICGSPGSDSIDGDNIAYEAGERIDPGSGTNNCAGGGSTVCPPPLS